MSTPPERTIGRYKVVRPIGQGGMGSLFLAHDPVIDRLVAIKSMREGFDNDELRERFAREARAAGRLRHPNIVTIFDVGEHEGQPFIAMEYFSGETIAEIVKRRAPLPIAKKLELVEEICDGLEYAHKSGMVHRDIKPANVMLDGEAGVKILDFGIVRLAESGMTQAGMLVGTLNYMSPEQMSGGQVDRRSDIFAVGALAYELFAYAQAFPGTLKDGVMHRIMHEPPRPLEEACPGIDPEIPAIVARALEKDAARRYQNLTAMRKDLAKIREHLEESADATAITPSPESDETVAVGPATPKPDSRPGTDRSGVAKRRAQLVERQIEIALAAYEAGDYKAALEAADQAVLIDPTNTRASRIFERAQAADDEQEAKRILTEARSELEQGNSTRAGELVDQALARRPGLTEARSLKVSIREIRRDQELARERAQLASQALERARGQLQSGAYEAAIRTADDVLALQPQHADARAIREQALEAIAEREREEERRRQEEARLRELERRQAEAREQRRQQRIAGIVEAAAKALDEGRLTDASDILGQAEDMGNPGAAAAALRQRLTEAQAEAERRARTRRRVDERLTTARRHLQLDELAEARAAVEAALLLLPDDGGALALLDEIARAEEAHAEARRREAEARADEEAVQRALTGSRDQPHEAAIALLRAAVGQLGDDRLRAELLTRETALARQREEEARRARAAEEARRKQKEEEERLAREAEAARLKKEEEARLAREAEEARRKKEEQERLAREAEAARLKREEEARLTRQAEEARRKKEGQERLAREAEAARLKREEEARLAREAEEARRKKEEQERLAREAEAARLKKAEEAQLAREAEEARRKEAAARKEAEARRKEEERHAREVKEQEERDRAARQKAEAESRRKQEQEAAARKAREADAAQAKREEEARLALEAEEARRTQAKEADAEAAKPEESASDDLTFTVYRPTTIAPETWHRMLVFAHLSELPPDAPPDTPEPARVVEQQAAEILGDTRGHRQQAVESFEPVPLFDELTLVPRVDGVEFEPPIASFRWRRTVHREEFRLRAAGVRPGQALRGRLSVFRGSIIVAEVALSMTVAARGQSSGEETARDTVQRYRQIFASYSHHDKGIVEEFSEYARAMGDRYLQDQIDLRSGERWETRLQDFIRQADVFQLFWSWNALESAHVRKEWQYALGLNRPAFVRPVYWEDPLPTRGELPPRELRDLHFVPIRPRSRRAEAMPEAAVVDAAPSAVLPPQPRLDELVIKPAPASPQARTVPKLVFSRGFAAAASIVLVLAVAGGWALLHNPAASSETAAVPPAPVSSSPATGTTTPTKPAETAPAPKAVPTPPARDPVADAQEQRRAGRLEDSIKTAVTAYAEKPTPDLAAFLQDVRGEAAKAAAAERTQAEKTPDARRTKDYAEAIDRQQQASRLKDPADTARAVTLFSGASDLFRSAIKNSSSDPGVFAAKARERLDRGDRAGAIDFAIQSLKLDPNNKPAAGVLETARKNAYDRAGSARATARAVDGAEKQSQYQEAEGKRRLGETPITAANAKEMIAALDDAPRLYSAAADSARKEAENTRRENQRRDAAQRATFAQNLFRQKSYDRAEEEASAALKLDPENALAATVKRDAAEAKRKAAEPAPPPAEKEKAAPIAPPLTPPATTTTAPPKATEPSPSPSPATPAGKGPDQTAAIQALFQQYKDAYEKADLAAVVRVYPGGQKAAAQLFNQYKSVILDLKCQAPAFAADGQSATMSCPGTIASKPRAAMKDPPRSSVTRTFTFTRATGSWLIANVQ